MPAHLNDDGSIVRLSGVHKWFGTHHVLKGIDLLIMPGDVLVVIGPSGSGKSTLLRCINLLELPSQGEVWFRGKNICDVRTNVNKVRTEIGIVFQAFNLFPHKTVLENVSLGLEKVLRLGRAQARERALQQLRRVGLEDKLSSYPRRISGGQQQRVAIARALAMEPALILFDEITSALDPELVKEVLQTMRRLASDGMTMAVVTHEMAFAREVGTRMVFMDEGVVIEQGEPEEMFASPRSERLARFLSQVL